MERPSGTLVKLCVALSFIAASEARAGFGDCTDPGYLGRFPRAESGASILCVEFFRFTYSTPGGERAMRGISDVAAGWAVPPAIAAGVERGAREAAAAMAALGRYAIDDVTLLLLDDRLAWRTTDMDIAGVADGRRDAATGRPGECLITLYGLSASSTPDEIAVTTAHEIFHCLQFATLSEEQMSSYGSGGEWWIEGTAEYFSAFAVSGSRPYTGRAEGFDAAVGADTALHAMAHESAPFFFWLGETRGPGALVPFMEAMAGSGGAAAQEDAMRRALDDRGWLDFAEAYADASITHPEGGALALSPAFTDIRAITGNTDQSVLLSPFTLALGEFTYDCGTWGHDLNPVNPNLSAQIGGEGAWSDWPEELDAREGRPDRIRFVGLGTRSPGETVSIEIERRRSCEPCAGADKVDACLVGVWQMTSGGPVEWMRAQGLPIVDHAESPRYGTFFSDGRFAAAAVGLELDMQFDDERVQGRGMSVQAFGRWSVTDGGRLNVCQDVGGVSGTVTTERGSMPVSDPGGGMVSMGYSCVEGSSLTTTMDMPGLPPMTTGYTWLAPPPDILPSP